MFHSRIPFVMNPVFVTLIVEVLESGGVGRRSSAKMVKNTSSRSLQGLYLSNRSCKSLLVPRNHLSFPISVKYLLFSTSRYFWSHRKTRGKAGSFLSKLSASLLVLSLRLDHKTSIAASYFLMDAGPIFEILSLGSLCQNN